MTDKNRKREFATVTVTDTIGVIGVTKIAYAKATIHDKARIRTARSRLPQASAANLCYPSSRSIL
jgi:hypothetical protein